MIKTGSALSAKSNISLYAASVRLSIFKCKIARSLLDLSPGIDKIQYYTKEAQPSISLELRVRQRFNLCYLHPSRLCVPTQSQVTQGMMERVHREFYRTEMEDAWGRGWEMKEVLSQESLFPRKGISWCWGLWIVRKGRDLWTHLLPYLEQSRRTRQRDCSHNTLSLRR